MNIAKPVVEELKSIQFSHYTANEIRQGSALTITNANTLDINGHPSKGGLFDSALGPHSRDFTCTTCSLGYFDCQGHYGHIELPLPVYSPTTFPVMYSFLKGACFFCFRFRISTAMKYIFKAKMLLFNHGLLRESMELEEHVSADKLNTNKDALDDDDEAEEAEEYHSKRSQQEEIDLLIQRIDKYVQEALIKSPRPIPLSEQKDFMMTKYRDSLVSDFVRKLSSYSDCQACRAPAMKLRRDGYSKIFLCPPSQKDTKKAPRPFVFSEATILAHRASLREKRKKDIKKIKMKTSQQPLDSAAVSEQSFEALDTSFPLASDYEANHNREMQHFLQEGANFSTSGNGGKEVAKTGQYLNPLVVQALLELIWHQEKVLLDLMLVSESRPTAENIRPSSSSSALYRSRSSQQLCFLEVLAVPPNKFRPPAIVNGSMFDNFRNSVLKEVILAANIIREKTQLLSDPALTSPDVPPRAYRDALYARNAAWLQMQNFVNAFIDNTKSAMTHYSNGTVPPGVRQLLEKKEGLFRKNMMGKRVNYAARSVISPDPWIEPNEIGVPYVFAKKLTYPEPVTGHNVNDLRQCVLNGPDVWPGATDIQLEDGRLQSLYGCTPEQRAALASQLLTPTQQYKKDVPVYLHQTNKKVFRHLRNDDIVLLNRQPTLHKPSIMAHRVRVLPGERTLRLHYANCNTYNADFDGDEMNIHLAQNQVARAEAFHIANSDHQYLVPTDGSPLRGLIQDHVVTAVLLTKRNAFFEKHDYHDLLMGALPQETMRLGRIRTLPPAICKPRPLWTGKQIITTLLLNLTQGLPPLHLVSKAKVGASYWGSQGEEEAEVRFCQGELVTGVLDKSQIGASAYGFVHSVYELYGGDKAGRLLGALSRLFSKYLLHMGFSVRLDDLLLTQEGDQWRRELLEEGRNIGAQAAMEYTQVESNSQLTKALERVLRDKEQHAGLDAQMKSKTNQLTSGVIAKCLPEGLFKKFPENGMQLMTVAGAKGSNVNVSQISCCLGQQELEGRRVPVMPSGKTLPSFRAFDPSARAGGFVAGRFLTGLNPQEYFFHCMAGREGLIDTAVKTARSGYLQRCLIKHLEGLRVHYDGSVRDSDGTLIQFLYGEDGLDVTKQKHLTQFRFCSENHGALNQRYKPADLEHHIDERKAAKLRRQFLKQRNEEDDDVHVSETTHSTLFDTIQSHLSPYAYLGSVSERFYKELTKYKEENPDALLYKKKKKSIFSNVRQPCLSQDGFEGLMYLKYLRSLVEPGEGVGILASQSIGEPSTQMTLNTFHFAGFGAKNVTLGIPRLREIIMTASTSIKTPTMALSLKPHVSEQFRDRFCRELSQLKLSAITKGVEVRERLSSTESFATREYRIRIDLFSSDDYQGFYHIDAKLVKNVIRHRLLKQLDLMIKKEHRLVKLGETMNTEDVIAKHHLSKLSKLKEKQGEDRDDQGGPSGRGEEDMEMDVESKRKNKRSKKNREAVEDDEDEEEEEGRSEGEGDEEEAGVTSSKYAKKKKQLATYDDDAEEEEEDEEKGEPSKKKKSDATSKGGLAMDLDAPSDDEEVNFDALPNLNLAFPMKAEPLNKNKTKKSVGLNEEEEDEEGEGDNTSQILGTHSYISSFEYFPKEGYCNIELRIPAKRKHLLMVPLLEKAIRSTVIREVSGISRCFPETSSSSKSKSLEVAADGVNLMGMWEYAEILDIHSLYSNDIYAMYKVYGVEAARACIIKEIGGVFAGYGISVDVRHLTLIADYMTFEGGYKPFNRYGINSNPSPFLKMSFETSCQFLKAATVIGDIDTLRSPSAKLVVGQVVESGSGCFEIVQPLVSV